MINLELYGKGLSDEELRIEIGKEISKYLAQSEEWAWRGLKGAALELRNRAFHLKTALRLELSRRDWIRFCEREGHIVF